MKTPRLLVLGSLGLSALLSLYSRGRPQEQAVDGDQNAATQEGVQVMARGPVHEAYAEPSVRKPGPTPTIPKQPPNPVEEMPPDQKPEGANVTWIPGYWAWDEDRSDFIWVSGIWRDLPPDHQWIAGYWQQADDGWQWVPGYWTVQAQQAVDYLPEPPRPLEEAVPPQPDAQSIYAPGCWVWHETRYMWRPGFWIGYRPGWIWTPAYYRWTPAGYVFVDGYWDYPFADRGLLFAPVFIDRAYWGRPRWFFRPNYVIQDTFLLSALFVRLNYGGYWFGDYFDPGYNRYGFIPWVNFRYGRTPSPLFAYYSWHYGATDPRWGAEMQRLYETRRADARARPPRTFAEATRVAVAAPAAKPGTFASIQTAAPLTPLTRVASAGVKLQPVPQAQLNEIRKAEVQHHEFSKQRAQVEAKALTQGQTAVKAGQPLKLDLPKTSAAPAVTTPGSKAKAPPPRPEHPNVEARQAPRAEPGPATRPTPTRPPVTRPEPKAEPKAVPKSEPKADPKAEPKREPKVEPRTAPKEEPKQAPRVEPKPAPAEPKPAPRVEPKPAPAEPKPAPRVEPKPAPAQPRPAPQPEPKPAPKEQKDKDKKDK